MRGVARRRRTGFAWAFGLSTLGMLGLLACGSEEPEEPEAFIQAAPEAAAPSAPPPSEEPTPAAARRAVAEARARVEESRAAVSAAETELERSERELEAARDRLEASLADLATDEAELAAAEKRLRELSVPDPVLFRNVQRELLEAPALRSVAIAAEVEEGRVTLRGRVPDQRTREAAEAVAGSVSGVSAVSNEIEVVR